MFLKVQQGQLPAAEVALNWGVVGLASVVMVLAAAGSTRTLVVSVGGYQFFS